VELGRNMTCYTPRPCQYAEKDGGKEGRLLGPKQLWATGGDVLGGKIGGEKGHLHGAARVRKFKDVENDESQNHAEKNETELNTPPRHWKLQKKQGDRRTGITLTTSS